MADLDIGTKELLNPGSIIDYIDDARIEKLEFKNDEGRMVDYNSLVLTFENGDIARFKLTPLTKAAIWYTQKYGKKVS